MSEGALHGIRVLDLTDERCIYGAKLLADLGADVVRPEGTEGDPLRQRGPFLQGREGDIGASLYYTFFGSNRQFLQDISSAEIISELLTDCDIVLSADERWLDTPLDLQAAREGNPGLISIDTNSFGTGGPWQHFVAPDLIAGALGGSVAPTGDVDTDPLKPFGELNFMVSGSYVAIAALSALHARDNTNKPGNGTHAQVCVHESIASCLEQVFMFYWYADTLMRPEGPVLPRWGSVHWSDAFAVMNGENGSIMMTPTPDFDKQLAWLIEEDAHADLIDPRFSEPENLRERIARTMELLGDWVADKDVEKMFFDAQTRHIPYGWVQPLERVPDNPQLAARNWFAKYSVAGEEVQGPGAPYLFSEHPWRMNASSSTSTATSENVADLVGWERRERVEHIQATTELPGRPLEGLRVLDFTHVLAGPFATRVMADMGADVIKVNSESRATTSNMPAHPYYIMWNRNKRALALDMSNPDARPLCRALAEKADIVIDNFSVGVLDRWGMGYESVKQTNPGVIYAQLSGMGEGGPWSDFVTYAPTIHALSGLTSLTGIPGRTDIGLGYSYNDHQAGLHGAVAILAALSARHRTGKGQRIDISQFEVGVNFAGPSLLDVFANGTKTEACGNNLPYDQASPHNVFRCAPVNVPDVTSERWIAIACMNQSQWQALCEVMGNPEWTREPRFHAVDDRLQNTADLDAYISAWTADKNEYALMQQLQEAGVPAGVVQNGADMVERDPQLQLSGFSYRIEDIHPEIGVTYADRLPIHFVDMACDEYRRVRALGEDNTMVLTDWLGLDAQQVADLEQQNILK